jgi:hypothetical protein
MHRIRLSSIALLSVITGGLLAWGSWSPSARPAERSYLGCDFNEYPGDDALSTLRKTFSFMGYWLSPPPGTKSTSWLGKRSVLRAQGFGFLVLYNGRLIRELKSVADGKQKGASDARNTARLARQEGFPAGTVIFLDIEEGGRLPAPYHESVRAWVDELAHEGFRAGVYCSAIPVNEGGGITIITANDLLNHLEGRKLVFFVFNDTCPPSPGCVFPQTPPALSQSGFAGAAIWQYAQTPRRKDRTAHCAATYAPDGNCYAPGDNAHKWFLDANVATSANPSAAQ